MNVGNSIRLAIDDFGRSETESAMLHACNAVDGTAAKMYPGTGVAKRFTTLIRDNYPLFGLMAMPGVNVETTRWPVHAKSTLGKGEWPDTADIIYYIHRCAHGHGGEVEDGFRIVDDHIGIASQLIVEEGTVRLPWNVIFGLLAVAVGESVNIGQRVPPGHYLEWGLPPLRFEINDCWGKKDDFLARLRTQKRPSVTMDWGEWTEGECRPRT